MASLLVIVALTAYKNLLSPVLPRCCRFEPTCSEYAMEAFRTFGFWRAMRLSTLRLMRCHPFCRGGYDPLPPRAENASRRIS
ncbi:membrane protein insertion efficiency factor YidD [bacterium]|nr:membrane protein insertion efficiency factor YidD [bacterium]